MTPAEADIAVKYRNKSRLSILDNVSFAIYSSIGKAIGGKKWEPIFVKSERKQKNTEIKMNKEDKQKELNYLKSLFN